MFQAMQCIESGTEWMYANYMQHHHKKVSDINFDSNFFFISATKDK